MSPREKEVERKKSGIDPRVTEIVGAFGKGEKGVYIEKCSISPGIKVIPTGIYKMDAVIGGGIPVEQMTLFWGYKGASKTSNCFRIIGEANKLCSRCYGRLSDEFGGLDEKGGCRCGEPTRFVTAYFAAEPIVFTDWATKLGVVEDYLIVVRPKNAEECFEVMVNIVKSGKVDLIVLDSLAAVVPEAEETGSMSDSQQAAQARIVGKFIRKVYSAIVQSQREFGKAPTFLIVNQVRQKVGVLFGCFNYNARVLLSDGSKKRIGEIVKGNVPAEVFSYNEKNGSIEKRKITGWFCNGKGEEWLSINFTYSGNGTRKFICTPNHRILSKDGWVSAGSLKVGDKVRCIVREFLSEEQKMVVLGAVLGDGNIRRKNGKSFASYLRFEHCKEQENYCRWKAGLLGDVVTTRVLNRKRCDKCIQTVLSETMAIAEIGDIFDEVYFHGGKKGVNKLILSKLSPLAIAIWYMDDGSLNVRKRWGNSRCSLAIHGFNSSERTEIKDFFISMGMECELYGGCLMFSVDGSMWFQEMICKYIPECMQYKLADGFKGKYENISLKNSSRMGSRFTEISSIKNYNTVSSGGHKKPTLKYNLEVEGDGNFFVSDVCVHNSPDIAPGGMAMGFATALEIKMWAKNKAETVEDEILGDKPMAIEVSFSVDKRRYGIPKSEGIYKLCLRGDGVKNPGDILDDKPLRIDGMKLGLIKREDSEYKFGDIKLGKKHEDIDDFLAKNRLVKEALKREVVGMLLMM